MDKINFKSRAIYSCVVLIPLFVFIIAHYTINTKVTGLLPTGFFNGEAPYYMANARQYLDHGFDSLFYGNPFSYLEEPQRVYFQFQTYLLGILIKLFPGSINCIWVSFGVVFAFLFMLQTTKVLSLLGVSKNYLFLVLILFAWGGGIQGVTGFSSEYLNSFNFIEAIKALEKFEIADGWWMQSIGRNFLMPNYIYYHFLVMTGIIFIIQKMNKSLLSLCFILSFSHPFVGAQFIFALVVWSIFERYYLCSRESKYFSCIGLIILLAIHVLYYFKFLAISSEHVAQEAQWSVTYESLYKNWAMRAINFIPSYILAFSLFFYQVRSPELFLRFFRNHVNRFLVVFGIVNFILANHEFAIKPIQPIHFTHGMVWFPFVLLGRDTLVKILKIIRTGSGLKRFGSIVLMFVFLIDNGLWMAKRTYQTHMGKSQTELPLKIDHQKIVDYVIKKLHGNYLFFVEDTVFVFHLAVYSKARVFVSHNIITPHSRERKHIQTSMLSTGVIPKEVSDEKFFFIIRSKPVRDKIIGESIFETNSYQIYKYQN